VDGVLGLNASRDLLLTGTAPPGACASTAADSPRRTGATAWPCTRPTTCGSWTSSSTAARRARCSTRRAPGCSTAPRRRRPACARPRRPWPPGTVRGPGIGVQPVRSARLVGDVRVGDVTFVRPIVGIVPMPPGYPGPLDPRRPRARGVHRHDRPARPRAAARALGPAAPRPRARARAAGPAGRRLPRRPARRPPRGGRGDARRPGRLGGRARGREHAVDAQPVLGRPEVPVVPVRGRSDVLDPSRKPAYCRRRRHPGARSTRSRVRLTGPGPESHDGVSPTSRRSGRRVCGAAHPRDRVRGAAEPPAACGRW
jgi:hypothetical protein